MVRTITRLAFPLACLAGLASCGSDDSASGTVRPAKLFTGYDDGSTTFKVPASFVGGSDGNVKWTLQDSSLATLERDPSEAKGSMRHVMVIAKKAGTTTLRASAGGTTIEIPVTITAYKPGAKAEGDDLYQDNRASQPTDTADPSQAQFTGLGCINCHGARGGPRHDPGEIGGYDDKAILKTIATGVKPDGSLANNGAHKFELSPEQQEAILARLRSLEPEGWP